MDKLVRSLHHVTATVEDAQEDLDFYLGGLGMRLVKKTVNFDNHNVYHFYYGDERGTPNTLMTTFPYKGWGVPVGTHGAGQITTTAFSVPEGALDAWRVRAEGRGLRVEGEGERFGEEFVRFVDPSGLLIELVANRRDARTPWLAPDKSKGSAVRGLFGVTLTIRDPEPTVDLLTRLLDFEIVNEAEGLTRLAVNGDLPGHVVDILHAPHAAQARNGLGTIHHVAFAVESEDDQARMREELVHAGLHVTPVRDRQYFKSIYFREPGGVLYEIATVPPGFTVDEDLSELGRGLKLPDWEEPYRPLIERGLPKVEH
jgi:glyoxalase family protein